MRPAAGDLLQPGRPQAASPVNRTAVKLIWPTGLVALIALALPFGLGFDGTHVVTAALLAILMCTVCIFNRGGGIVAAVVYLALLGDYRRFVAHFTGFPQSDPLLLVGPIVAVFLLCASLLDRGISVQSPLSRLIVLLMMFMTLEMFNPLQGGLTVGLAGALFYLAPLLWFWIGQKYGSKELLEFLTFGVVVAIGVMATIWGAYQSYFGLFDFEMQWVEAIGYAALHISADVIRPIGFFTSSAEFTRYLVVTAAIMLAAWLAGRSLLIVLMPLVLAVLFLAASRGPVVIFAVTAVVLWAISARRILSWIPRLLAAAAAAAAALILLLSLLQSHSVGGRVAPLVDRQVEGLLNPTDPDKSTALGHAELVRLGLGAAVTAPAGLGLGATTLAARKYGTDLGSTEIDFSNIMVSLGILGGVLYAAIVVTVLWSAVRWWKLERSRMALATVGILIGTAGGWLIGGEYSTVAFVWFCVGAMDRLSPAARRG